MPKTAGIISQQKTSTARESMECNFLEEKSQIKTKTKLASSAKGVVRLKRAMYFISLGCVMDEK